MTVRENMTLGKEVIIKIDNIGDYINATVVYVDDFWKDRASLRYRKDGVDYYSTAFNIGMKLIFGPNGGRILKPEHLPWFVLDVKNEKFEHYR